MIRALFLFCLLLLSSLEAERPRIALVLGGGGARGLAHIGVLEELEKAEIPIDLIVGCSVGGIVGALYADCRDAGLIHTRFDGLKRRDLVDFNVLRGWSGLSEGRALRRFLKKNLKHHNFEDLSIPFAVVATDLESGERVIFDEGPIMPAVQASAAFPLVFQPVVINGRTFMDGGVVEPVPVSVALERGAEIVIAVDVGLPLTKSFQTNLFAIAQRSVEILYARQSQICSQDANVVIRPDLGDIGIFDDNHTQFAYEAGRMAARKAIPVIMELIQNRSHEEEQY